ncbi:hypothetical protein HPB47_018465 [Ixodes persulcatus]|uniref:Uncharacterized protein n=1 Tax=Ixodes persulcatus TaxID=34615 RepID=A0AC60QP98_IXOPE|nr:hypothetical protein HPB47_018465 [Ixodes persulcatus]
MNDAPPPHVSPSTDMDTDPDSGRTVPPDNPWITVLKKRAKKITATATTTSQAAGQPQVHQAPAPKPSPREPPPRLPPTNYTVIFRPRAGLNVATLTTAALTEALSTKCELPLPTFYRAVTLLVQPTPNVLVASTADPELAVRLSEIQQLQISTSTYEFSTYMKPPPGTCRGVIHGLDSSINKDNLGAYLQGNYPTLLHARIMGNTRSALLTFQGTRVPFYVKGGSMLLRCRPFRRSVQVCHVCGELGHRMDVCPNPDSPKCLHCGQPTPSADHVCIPKCRLCSQPHTTAGKDCPRRFFPNSPTSKTSTQAADKVSWSALASRAPTAQLPPQRDTQNYPPLSRLAPLPATIPTALLDLLKNLQQQNADLLRRVEALEAERAPQFQPPPHVPVVTPPITRADVEEIIDAQFTARSIPQVQQQVQQSTEYLSKMITDSTKSIFDLLSERISLLERALLSDHPPQAKKSKPDGQ